MVLCKLHHIFPLCGGIGFGLGGECGIVFSIAIMLAGIQLENEALHYTTQQNQTEFFVLEGGLVNDGGYCGEAVRSVIATHIAGVGCTGSHEGFREMG